MQTNSFISRRRHGIVIGSIDVAINLSNTSTDSSNSCDFSIRIIQSRPKYWTESDHRVVCNSQALLMRKQDEANPRCSDWQIGLLSVWKGGGGLPLSDCQLCSYNNIFCQTAILLLKKIVSSLRLDIGLIVFCAFFLFIHHLTNKHWLRI